MSSNIYDALWINIPSAKASRLLHGKGIRVKHEDFEGGYNKKTRGFVIQPRHHKKLEGVIKNGKTYTLKFNEEELLANTHHPFHKVKIGAGFWSDVWSGVKQAGAKVAGLAKKALNNKYGQAVLKGIDLLGATEGIPPGVISGVTNRLLGIGDEPAAEEQTAEDQGVNYGDVPEGEYVAPEPVHPKTKKTYDFPAPPVKPNGEQYTNENPPPLPKLPPPSKLPKAPSTGKKIPPPPPPPITSSDIPNAPPMTKGKGLRSYLMRSHRNKMGERPKISTGSGVVHASYSAMKNGYGLPVEKVPASSKIRGIRVAPRIYNGNGIAREVHDIEDFLSGSHIASGGAIRSSRSGAKKGDVIFSGIQRGRTADFELNPNQLHRAIDAMHALGNKGVFGTGLNKSRITQAKNGRFMLNGRFISNAQAQHRLGEAPSERSSRKMSGKGLYLTR